MDFFMQLWEYLMAIFYVSEKIVKLTPTKKDDILFDVIFSGIKKLSGINKMRN